MLLVTSAAVCAMSASNFGYAVNDPLTGDNKDQQEVRSGGTVMGYYRLVDADGLTRTVNYQADPVNGFTAQVDRSPGAAAIVPAAAPMMAPAIPIGRASLAPQLITPTTANIGGYQQKYNFQQTTLGALPAGWAPSYLRK